MVLMTVNFKFRMACSSPFISSLGSKHVFWGSAQQQALKNTPGLDPRLKAVYKKDIRAVLSSDCLEFLFFFQLLLFGGTTTINQPGFINPGLTLLGIFGGIIVLQ